MTDPPPPSSFRFRPPPAGGGADLDWVLAVAFGATAPTARRPADPSRAARLARALGLSARLAKRAGRETLTEALGGDRAEALHDDLYRATARAVVLLEQAEVVAHLAAELGIQIIVLKGAALIAAGACRAGERPFGDLDLLVANDDAERLAAAVVAEGFVREPIAETDHHLPLLRHPRYGLLELHLSLPDLRVADEPRATAEEILGLDLCRPSEIAGALLPADGLLAAHAVAHGVAQHGLAPGAYPFLRCFGDLVDLAVRDVGIVPLLSVARPWLESSLSSRELDAVGELASSLAGGERPDSPDAVALLDHAVAGALDPDYRRALKVDSLRATLARRDWKKLGRRTRSTSSTVWAGAGRVRYPRQTALKARLDAFRELLVTPISWLRIRARRR